MKENFFIIHGAHGNPEENWFPWLNSKLQKLGHEVYTPLFPTPAGQNLSNWLKVFDNYKEFMDKNSVFVAHSLGPVFVLNLLENINKTVKASFFVSGFYEFLRKKKFDEINRTFVKNDFDWEKVKGNCEDFYMFHSDNDPYVPLEKAENLAEKLDADMEVIEGAGHFNEEAGYTEFPRLLEKMKKELEI